MKKHVIFLGAGASVSSGYPLANNLRLLLASPKDLLKRMGEFFPKCKDGSRIELDQTNESRAAYDLQQKIQSFSQPVDHFRRGGFSTVDEFSKIAIAKYRPLVNDMKRLLAIALSIHNPEDSFHTSDYYGFVQKCFRKDSMEQLRDDLTVVTFNYDCHLDYILLNALRQRHKLAHNNDQLDIRVQNLVTSGFTNLDDRSWVANREGFKYLKLHGSACCRSDSMNTDIFQMLFERDWKDRWTYLASPLFNELPPPVMFPWEIFPSSQKATNLEEFVAAQVQAGVSSETAVKRFRLLVEMWVCARDAVAEADRISFVGLSMHEFLRPGFEYLFNNVKGNPEVIVANPQNADHPCDGTFMTPLNPAVRTFKILNQLVEGPSPWRISSVEKESGKSQHSEMPITQRFSFSDFINHEMSD